MIPFISTCVYFLLSSASKTLGLFWLFFFFFLDYGLISSEILFLELEVELLEAYSERGVL